MEEDELRHQFPQAFGKWIHDKHLKGFSFHVLLETFKSAYLLPTKKRCTSSPTGNAFHCLMHAGEQERKAENLEKVHAETLRGGSRRIDAEPPPGSERDAEDVVGPMPLAVEDAAETLALPLAGPIPPEAGDVEDDPYNLPITHEVTLEGARTFKTSLPEGQRNP